MNIYQVTRTTLTEYDFDMYSGFICFAQNEEQAKNLDPSFPEISHPNFSEALNIKSFNQFIDWENDISCCKYSWVDSINDLIVTKLGTSESEQVGIILSSYHSG